MDLKKIWNFLSRRKGGKLDFFIVNAFTGKEGNAIGNPAAICVVDEFPSEAGMGEMAKKLGTPMTTFLRRTGQDGVYEVKHFSPDGNENHVCGHALVAASEHLARQNPEFRKGKEITFLLNPRYKINPSNSMKARINGDDISLTLPAVLEMQDMQSENFYTALADALNISGDRIIRPAYFVPRINNYLIVLKSQDDLVSLQPDFKKLKAISLSREWPPMEIEPHVKPDIEVTAKSDESGYDVLNRVFSPCTDVNEDIACGSANCSVIPYWSLKDKEGAGSGKKEFRVLYPYPPGEKGFVGGVQDITIDAPRAEITITARATFKKTVSLGIPADKRRASGPKKDSPKY